MPPAFEIAALWNPPWQGRKVAIMRTSFRKPPRFGKACPRIIHLWTAAGDVAVTTMAAFLRVNGYRLEFDDDEAFSFLVRLYETGTLRFDELDTWLRQHAVLTDPST